MGENAPTVKRAVARLAKELEEVKKKLAETEVEKLGLSCESEWQPAELP